jgi:ankyrin repeat protein
MKSHFAVLLVLFVLFAPSFSQNKISKNDKIAEQFADAAEGNLDTVKSMLASGVNVNIEPSYHKRWTPLMAASTFGETPVVEYLISKGANVKVILEDGETTLIQSAQSEGNSEIVKALLKAGVEINAKTKKRLTASMRFAWAGQFEAVKLLLDAGADAKLINENGWTAFYFACSHGNDEKIVKYLLAAGANPNEKDANGQTPLMWVGWGTARKISRL